MNGFEGMTVAEQVNAEARANGYRREAARQLGATVRGSSGLLGQNAAAYQVGERFRGIAAELARDEAAERMSRRAAMKAPSDLIATMRDQWPEQSAAVKAFAEETGLPLGEAWARAIGDAVANLRKGRK
jgi:hypothetical protein